MRMHDRLARLEVRQRSAPDIAARQREDADVVSKKIASYAAHFPDAAFTITEAERIGRLSPAEHVAWTIRFSPQPVSIAKIMDLHGHPLPAGLVAKLEMTDEYR